MRAQKLFSNDEKMLTDTISTSLIVIALLYLAYTEIIYHLRKKARDKKIEELKEKDVMKLSEDGNLEEVYVQLKKDELDQISDDVRKTIEEDVLKNKLELIKSEFDISKKPVQIKFEEAMFIIRDNKKRTVVSEDGKVDITVNSQYTNFENHDMQKREIVNTDINDLDEVKQNFENEENFNVTGKEISTPTGSNITIGKNGKSTMKVKIRKIIFENNKIVSTPSSLDKEKEEKASNNSKSNESLSNEKLMLELIRVVAGIVKKNKTFLRSQKRSYTFTTYLIFLPFVPSICSIHSFCNN